MLSKSKYIKGLQCEKRLWLDKHQPDLRDALSYAQEALFAQGSSVGELAQHIFPGGKDATPDFSRPDGIPVGLQQTKQWIEEGAEVIYEAAVSAGGIYAAMDILVKEAGGWQAIEVKSSTSVKAYHINDTAVQFYAFRQAGIHLVDIEVMYINNQYERQGELDLNQLFTRQSVLEEILPLQNGIPDRIEAFSAILRQSSPPEVAIGPHCSDPFPCDFISFCWMDVPEQNVLNISRIGARGWQLFNEGIIAITDIPDDLDLNAKQRNQVDGEKYNKEVFDKNAIRDFLSEWQYPLYFFDFETIGPSIPLFDGTRPYQQYPHQYSLHILHTPDGELEHRELLADPLGDPRETVIQQMLLDLGTEGSIVTYNMGFEKGKIKALAESFPSYADELMAIHDRVVDLIVPFRSHWCYMPAMNGSASIKKVLPALTDLKYDDLDIQDGNTASEVYLSMLENRFEGNLVKTLADLKAYCKLDTLAMVEIWRVLWDRINSNEKH